MTRREQQTETSRSGRKRCKSRAAFQEPQAACTDGVQRSGGPASRMDRNASGLSLSPSWARAGTSHTRRSQRHHHQWRERHPYQEVDYHSIVPKAHLSSRSRGMRLHWRGRRPPAGTRTRRAAADPWAPRTSVLGSMKADAAEQRRQRARRQCYNWLGHRLLVYTPVWRLTGR